MYGVYCMIVHRRLFLNKINIFPVTKPLKQAFLIADQTACNRTIEELK